MPLLLAAFRRVVVEELMARAGLSIPRERWYSNLTTRGNTGAASIFIMLADFLRERELQPGQRILCFVPESARFTVAFMMLEVVKSDAHSVQGDATVEVAAASRSGVTPTRRTTAAAAAMHASSLPSGTTIARAPGARR